MQEASRNSYVNSLGQLPREAIVGFRATHAGTLIVIEVSDVSS